MAFGTLTARSGARILTAVTNTGPIRGTIRIQDTLGATTFVGIPEVILDAGTRPGTVLFPTDGIGPTWAGHTRGLILFGNIGWKMNRGGRLNGKNTVSIGKRRCNRTMKRTEATNLIAYNKHRSKGGGRRCCSLQWVGGGLRLRLVRFACELRGLWKI